MIKSGGPAFPTEHTDTSGLYDGMFLRDYFAAKAMQGLTDREMNHGYDAVASYAYKMADAMLKAREL